MINRTIVVDWWGCENVGSGQNNTLKTKHETKDKN